MSQQVHESVEQAVETTVTYSAVPATKEWLAVTAGLTTAGIAGRAAFQHIPSVEPVLAVAIGVAFFGGLRYGAASGASAFILSNFIVWGWQGPWTIFQTLGAVGAALAGYMAGKSGAGPRRFFTALIGGTLVFEAVINIGSVIYTPWAWASLPTYFLAAVPFGAVHIASTLAFGAILYGFNSWLTEAYADRLAVSVSRSNPVNRDTDRDHADTDRGTAQ